MEVGDFVHLAQAGNPLKLLPQLFASRQTFRIGHEPAAHGTHRKIFNATLFNRQFAMPLNQCPFLRWLRRRQDFAGREEMFRLRKNPWRTHRRPPDHRPGDAGLRTPSRHVSRTVDIAITDDRDRNRCCDLRDHVPIGRPRISLRPRPPVDRESSDA